MLSDVRLCDPMLLILAAKRLLARRDQPPPVPDWRETEGLSTLLDYAKTLPVRDPWHLPAATHTGMARLLVDARRQLGQEEPP